MGRPTPKGNLADPLAGDGGVAATRSARPLLAFRSPAGFNLRVQPHRAVLPAGLAFPPARFAGLLALLIAASFPQVLLGLETFVARDFGFFAYPGAQFQRDCFAHGELPFWNPFNNCGGPFLAQWNTMPLYPPALFYLLLPLHWALGMFSLLHLWWAGLGMYGLARRWSGNDFAAAFAGLVFAFNGFTLNLVMWPSHIATFSWLPWVVLLTEAAWRAGGRKIFLAALAGALQMLAGGPETILFTWLIVAALWLLQLWQGGGDAASPSVNATGASPPPRCAVRWRLPLVGALVFALAAAQLLPVLDLVAHAQRAAGFADLRWSMPGSGLANFLLPTAFGSTATEGIFFQHGQYWTSSYYLGLGTLWLALLAALGLRDRRAWLLGALAVAGVVLALGDHTPVLPALRRLLPQLSFVTYPIKYVALTVFAAPLLAAFALANLARVRRQLLPLGGVLLLLLGAVFAWSQCASRPGETAPVTLLAGLTRGGFLLLTGGLLVLLAKPDGCARHRWLPLVLLLVAWADVYTHEPNQNPTVPSWIYEPNLTRPKLALQPQPELGLSRAMVSPHAALEFINFAASDPKNNFITKRLGYCANANLLDGVPKVDGFFSLTPQTSDAVLSLFYSTTDASYPGLEAFLGVSQRTAPDSMYHWLPRTNYLPLVTAGQQPVFLDDSATLTALRRRDFDGSKVVYLPESEQKNLSVTNAAAAKILSVRFATATVDITAAADAPALVVVAQSYYHWWTAEVDGQPARLLRANEAFQAVAITAGTHHIHLAYRDRGFELGAALSLAALAACGFGLLWPRRRPASAP